ncbi:hypothetical protein [Actinomadura violacea]|uniref:CoA carboxyltransferase N-terminal domain-containing protein n=1 Tax=Actinomadura violacea TaxID=2819934 RepID=A0ABS3S150_9ACTN|nr:hypothetical protein [Actinomadura violacea]MBO2462636.1 hypothetical protein [Actinomadura violacea]
MTVGEDLAAWSRGEGGLVPAVPWVRCDGCGELVYGKAYARNLNVCQICGGHGPLTAPQWIATLLDPSTVRYLRARPTVEDPIDFTGLLPFRSRLERDARRTTSLVHRMMAARSGRAGEENS